MKRYSWLILVVISLTATLGAWGGQTPAGDPRLQGTWGILSLEVNGETIAVDKLQDARLTVQGEKYFFRLGDTRLDLTHKADATKKPCTLDMTVTAGALKGKTYHAIYAIENGNLKICRHLDPDKARPTRFATQPNSGLMLIVWKRVPVTAPPVSR
jgi:uncharacterized protein (TIGR03067 family)